MNYQNLTHQNITIEMDVEQSASWDRNHTNIRRTFSMPSAIFSRNIISDSPIKEMTSSE